MDKSKLKNKNGITMIALVVTIVVIVIVAAITMNTALSGDLIGTAQEISKKPDKAEVIQMARKEILKFNIEKNKEATYDEVMQIIAKYDKDGEIKGQEAEDAYIETEVGNKILTTEIWKVRTYERPKSWNA